MSQSVAASRLCHRESRTEPTKTFASLCPPVMAWSLYIHSISCQHGRHSFSLWCKLQLSFELSTHLASWVKLSQGHQSQTESWSIYYGLVEAGSAPRRKRIWECGIKAHLCFWNSQNSILGTCLSL